MKITQKQYDKTKDVLPVQHSDVAVDHFTFLNTLQYMCENGCRRRALLNEFGNGNAVYGRQ